MADIYKADDKYRMNNAEENNTEQEADDYSGIAGLLVKEGYLEPDKYQYAQRVRNKLTSPPPLLEVVRELGYASNEDIQKALQKNRLSLRLGDLLTELGSITESELQAALALQKESPEPKLLGEILLEQHFIEEHKLAEVLANQLGFLLVFPSFAEADPALLRQVTPRWCTQHKFFPFESCAEGIVIAFVNPMSEHDINAAESSFGETIIPAIATESSIKSALAAWEQNLKSAGGVAETSSGSAVTIVNQVIISAIEAGASDIHIEPLKDHLQVRFRCDGVMRHHKDFSNDTIQSLTARLKVMSEADITERRRHQGGRIEFEDPTSGHSLDIRASFYSTIYGECIVLRLLNRQAQLLDIEQLGMAPSILKRFTMDALDNPSGVIIITGPTGSGKTTTLYSCINYLNDMETSIITAEDPVEYVISGISQCSINPKINVTFEETLRHIVRQDPDVVVLGEIRDQFSAETAIQAALTGHKVLTTFHTEDSIGGLLRLLNMDIEAFLISSTVVCVVAQRLLRAVCENCAEPYTPTAIEYQKLGLTGEELAGARFLKGKGCNSCHYTGYHGRVGVFELLVLNEDVKDALLNRKTSSEIRRISIQTSGLITLMEDGVVKAAKGKTTLSEILRQLPRLEKPRPLNKLIQLVGN